MIKVAVTGCLGRMGSTIVEAVTEASDMEVICGVDINAKEDVFAGDIPIFTSAEKAFESFKPDVMVDFTVPSAAAGNIKAALSNGIDCVVGTTGVPYSELEQLAEGAEDDACLFFAPNFTTGAVLMMKFAEMAARYFPQAEVIEFHHCNKKDAPSGTAVQTAKIISSARGGQPSEAPGKDTEIPGCEGARGALVDGIPVHSVRSMGFVANQEVDFGSFGQSLTIKHESWDRHSYMPGVLLAIREVGAHKGLVIGLENFMEL